MKCFVIISRVSIHTVIFPVLPSLDSNFNGTLPSAPSAAIIVERRATIDPQGQGKRQVLQRENAMILTLRRQAFVFVDLAHTSLAHDRRLQ